MSSRDTVEFLALAAIWGASFLFMRVAAPEFGPLSLMLVRCAIGAATLLPILLWHGKGGELLANGGRLLVIGTLNSAIPFVLLGYAALSLTAGVTSILNALAPLWTAVIAWVWFGDRLTRAQVIGLGAGAVGVTILVVGGGLAGAAAGGSAASAGDPTAGGGGGSLGRALLPFAAGVLAAVFYGIAANAARRWLVGVHPLSTATGSQLGATLVLLVPGVLSWPARTPEAAGVLAAGGTGGSGVDMSIAGLSMAGVSMAGVSIAGVSGTSWLAALALGMLCTGVAYLLFFRLLASVGATRTIAVTFVIPLFGVGWGALFLAERIDVATLVGGLVIVLGTALTTGVLRVRGGVARV